MNPADIDIDINTLSYDEFKRCDLVDIREPEECDLLPPQTKKIHFKPLSKLAVDLTFYQPDRTYLLVCAKGGRSHQLALYLKQQGVTALSVNEGINALNGYLDAHEPAS